jgi:septum formation protein
LASASPRRQELLQRIGITDFTVRIPDADESYEPAMSPEEIVCHISRQKSLALASADDEVVITADTMVFLDDKRLGKPKDEADAFRMLKLLSGKKHAVYTGVSFQLIKNGEYFCRTKVDKTLVYFHNLSDEWIWKYVKGGSPMDKAGAYGIQDGGLVKGIKGSYTNVVGFPLELVQEMIENVRGGKHD